MNIQLKKGTAEYLDCCRKAMENMVFKTRDKIFLVDGDYNPGAKIFDEKSGYKYIGTIPGRYRKGIDEYLMMKVYDGGD
ncbi:MAG: hypothetical protein LBQ71_13860 [Hungatella sp.]|uniref:hypothetical protein n=1 Tax=Clostridium sp. NkU-1 TaxID=1095009 RepID=UPI0028198AE0|nr:hypothetical protein [Hungatella sp.]